MIPFKSDYCFAWLNEKQNIQKTQDEISLFGCYYHDIRCLSTYFWNFEKELSLIWSQRSLDRLMQHWSLVGHHDEALRISREIKFNEAGFHDHVILHNPSAQKLDIPLKLYADADFEDLFALRTKKTYEKSLTVQSAKGDYQWEQNAQLPDENHISISLQSTEEKLFNQEKTFSLEPYETKEITITAYFKHSAYKVEKQAINIDDWQNIWQQYAPAHPCERKAYDRAVHDLHSLLLNTPFGAYPAAGVPFFVTAFGRDGLLTANMILPQVPKVAASVLRFAAHIQGTKTEAYREEEQGKIFHEVRHGPLANINTHPFGRYYGTADATSLWVKLLGDYYDQTQDIAIVKELEPNLDAAIAWIVKKMEKTGFVQFAPEGRGLMNQNWKDSPPSNCHKDGSLAQAPIANTEVQAYSYAALKAAAKLYKILGRSDDEAQAQKQAEALYQRIQDQLWSNSLQNYVMGLDADGRQLEVLGSNAGHLLWCQAVPKARAQLVIDGFMRDDMWSGWGLRTLSEKEKGYSPLGYHVGTVWPFDTALFAIGAYHYGNKTVLNKAASSLLAIAQCYDNHHMPEVISGFTRKEGEDLIPYVRTCFPQAWSCAALLSLHAYKA